MNRSTRTWWLIYTGCIAFVGAAMLGITALVLRMERNALEMRAEADRIAEIRAALWDMESWLIPHLGREASRPAVEYLPYMPADHVYTRYLSEIAAGDVFSPSPLLTFDSELFPIHFEIHESGAITSPQVPTGNELDLAQATLLPDGWIERKQRALEGVRSLLGFETAFAVCGDISLPPEVMQTDRDRAAPVNADDSESAGESLASQPQPPPPPQQLQQQFPLDSPKLQQWRAQQDHQRRVEAQEWSKEAMDRFAYGNIAVLRAPDRGLRIGAFIPTWLDVGEGDRITDDTPLVFLREVRVDGATRFQGFLCDWPRLRAQLLAQVADRFEHIEILPIGGAEADVANGPAFFRLASIPAEVRCASAPLALMPRWTPARTTLGLAWLAVVAAVVAAGLTLRSTIDFAQRRSRFASTVTHELRTPLTTFRMYSEMLADDMVPSPEKQRRYHETLREEAVRLSAIVENVLAYARVEEGRSHLRRESIAIDALIDRILPGLHRRAEESGAVLNVDRSAADGGQLMTTDVECIDQILANLVDNACKYGCNGDPGAEQRASSRIDLTASTRGGRLNFTVRDYGPGIDPRVETMIFRPFERGRIEPGSIIPGVGLGLAISRGLAATLGGTLGLKRPSDGEAGACFILSVPIIRTNS